KRAEYFPHVFNGNVFLFTTGRTRKDIIEPALSTHLLNGLNCMDSGARGFPLYLQQTTPDLFDQDNTNNFRPNLSQVANDYLQQMEAAEQELFFHCLSILHSLTYRQENTSAMRSDWPRIPLPNSAALLQSSAALGHQVAALLDTERPVAGVTTGAI